MELKRMRKKIVHRAPNKTTIPVEERKTRGLQINNRRAGGLNLSLDEFVVSLNRVSLGKHYSKSALWRIEHGIQNFGYSYEGVEQLLGVLEQEYKQMEAEREIKRLQAIVARYESATHAVA